MGGGHFTAGSGASKATHVHDPIAIDNGERYSGDVQAVHLPFDVGIDGIIGGVVGGGFCQSRLGEQQAGYRQHTPG